MMVAVATNRYSILALSGGNPPPALGEAIDRLRATLLPLGGGTDAARNMLGARIDRFVEEADRQVILLAHGAGCRAAAWWARLSPSHYVQRVAGAILVDPLADDAGTRFASPATLLPFRSMTLDSTGRIEALAREWGSEVMPGGTAVRGGALLRLIDRLSGAVVAHDVRTAEKLAGLG
ncbi:alpha/beta hydrolase [uncultured Sphingomonas sp.]|uniref:alpha/beta hydrolase n=1 Tax=uncultured Sphingomonas sp. TaxID=158754 RepID=UPI00258B9344|nr:alpha/beta hydrolase [uncultured Sphingomonas sp.]